MFRKIVGILLLVVVLNAACLTKWDYAYGNTYRAEVVIKQDVSSTQKISGHLYLEQGTSGSTLIFGYVEGLSDGQHGFHIHADGNLNGSCLNAGAHYNPFNVVHGGPDASTKHIGDLGNILSFNKNSTVVVESKVVKLAGEYSVIGRSFVVHADVDDFGMGGFPDSNSTGHAGARLACGEICYLAI